MLKNPKTYLAFSLLPVYFLVKFLSNYPEIIEYYYSNGIYPILSKALRYGLGWIPFSFGDLVYAFGVIYMVRWIIKNRKRFFTDTQLWLIDMLSAVTLIYFAFHLFWGMNYYRLPLHKNLNLEADYSTAQLVSVTEKLINKTNSLQLEITKNDTVKVEMPYSKTDIMKRSGDSYKNLEAQYPHLAYQPRSIKKSLFSVPLTYMGFSGYLNPLTNEAQVDYLIPSYKFATTSAHEMAHQLGYAAENEANFIGCLATINNDDIYMKYSGYAFGLRHCLNEIYRRDPEQYERIIEHVNIGILKNYEETRLFWDSYQNPLEPLFKESYNSYLQANNQQGGMDSYSYVVALLVNYFQKHPL
ncbi:DUF3810 domain-containing protein [Formosa sediminum]|uniref:DUF3810 domain-containing protein n=1 Tax=Formosa sediminum TaxID=2594004 RepID=A0A516GV63_9FLAO|nr:DUF3810 domain-containing protein [Formosa sediminum]QDO95402.1 DUF3810 domain-containing protein [Formosa sediminum]